MNKIVLIGCGNVGLSYAYALITHGINVNELVLIDINQQKAEGEALDLTHALPFAKQQMKVRAGTYDDCSNAKIVVIAAGRNQNVGETRKDLLHKNYEVFKSIITEINKTKFSGIYLIATNPLDAMTQITQKLSGFDYNKVIGTGTTLDTSRLRFLLSNELKVNPQNIHANVIGEHGDSEVVVWENAMLGTQLISKLISKSKMDKITDDVKQSAYEIIKRKGNTSFGIGMCMLKITQSILNDQNNILTVSAYDEGQDVYYSRPCIVNANGVEKELDLELSAETQKLLDVSIESIKAMRDAVFTK